jgi:hypothetical protein
MTRDKDRKRIIRNRMKTTGESYTTARRQVLARAAKPAAPSLTSRARVGDYAAVAGKSDDTMRRQTGRPWQEWLRLLEADGAGTMTHGAIARLVHEKYDISGWWAQTVTVGYERLTGRRETGQRISGAYEASKSKTFNVPVTTLFDAWAQDRKRRRWLDAADVSIRSSTSPKSMRLQWPDGTIVAAWFESKGPEKSSVAIAHTKLGSRAALEQAKAEWSQRLDALARALALPHW